MWCDETPHHAHHTTSRRERRVTGRFAPKSVRPIGRIQRFLLIQLKPKHVFRWGVRAVFRDTLCNVSAVVKFHGRYGILNVDLTDTDSFCCEFEFGCLVLQWSGTGKPILDSDYYKSNSKEN